MKYITDEIGDSYKDWERACSIIISAPTGSGKTYFILNKLLKLVCEKNSNMILYTNRVALAYLHNASSIPDRVGLADGTCQNAKTDSIGILFCYVIWVNPIGSEFLAVEECFDLIGGKSFGKKLIYIRWSEAELGG